jgi:uncharacterized protein DUF5989
MFMDEFEKIASGPPRRGLAGELWAFLAHTGKWWLLPVLVVLLLLGLLLALSGGAAAPFIYTLF